MSGPPAAAAPALRVSIGEDDVLLREGIARILTDAGLVAAVEIRRRLPGTGVLILSQFCEPAFALQLIGDRPEGVGYLLKERVGDVASFTDAVARVAGGGSALDPEVVGRM